MVPQELYPPLQAGIPAGASISGAARGGNFNARLVFRISTAMACGGHGVRCSESVYAPQPRSHRMLRSISSAVSMQHVAKNGGEVEWQDDEVAVPREAWGTNTLRLGRLAREPAIAWLECTQWAP
jgi:hypothetical protein